MTIDSGRRTAIVAAITALNGAGLLQNNLPREALAGAVLIADAAGAASMQSSTVDQVLKELDHIMPSGHFVTVGGRTVRGWTKTTVLAAIA